MIQCTGTIETPNGSYTNPVINPYFLSYSQAFGILAFPQIFVDNYPIDQLTPLVIDGPGSEMVNRVDVQNAMCLYLSNEYPNCQFNINTGS